MTYYLTFGQASPLKDGWIEVEAARRATAVKYGMKYPHWSDCYRDGEFDRRYYPQGCIGRVERTAYDE